MLADSPDRSDVQDCAVVRNGHLPEREARVRSAGERPQVALYQSQSRPTGEIQEMGASRISDARRL